MAARNSNNNAPNTPPETIVDVVSTKGDKVIVNSMTHGQAILLKSKNGWVNKIYQPGYHGYKTNIETKKT